MSQKVEVTFAEQSEIWIEQSRTRRRAPLKRSSFSAYRTRLDRWVLPVLGDRKLAEFTPLEMRSFVSTLAPLAPRTVNEIVVLVKQIIASATDEQGLPLYPKTFNSRFIDLPVVDRRQQRTPTVTREQIEQAIVNSNEETFRCLYALAGASGLRIGELLAIKLTEDGASTVFDGDTATIRVRRSMWRGREGSTKTAASVRDVEIPIELSSFIARFAGARTGYLFGKGRVLLRVLRAE